MKRFLAVLLTGTALRAEALDLAELVEKVAPAVVNIQTTQFVKTRASFESYMKQLPEPAGSVRQSSLGTGFVVASTRKEPHADGEKLRSVLILTNRHVVEDSQAIEIQTREEPGAPARTYPAQLVAVDARMDLAVLRAQLPTRIEPLKLGDSDALKAGAAVFAIGNPFGLGHTVTAGILSAKDRSLGLSSADRYLQTDTAINFGNSGGPLFDAKGSVIGMNTLVRTDAQGIGFAIPSNQIKKSLPVLETSGKVERGWLGLVAENATTAYRNHFKIRAAAPGVVVTRLVKDGPAHKLGLKEGDFVFAAVREGKTVSLPDVSALRDFSDELKPGEKVELKVLRAEREFVGKLEPAPVPQGDKLPDGYEFF
jgi:serine protease Do